MNAALRHDPTPAAGASMKGPVIASTLFHVALFTITAVGIPFVAKDPVMISQPINVEIIEIDKVTQTNRAAPPQKREKEPTPPAEEKPAPSQMTADKPPDLLSPKPPDLEKPEDDATPEEAVPPPVKKEAEIKPPPKPEKPKSKPKPPQKKEDQFTSLLRNLTPDLNAGSENEEALDPTQKNSSALSQIAQLSQRMTISELDAIRRQLEPCWNVPTGVKYAEDLAVEIRVFMNRDGTVQNASILNQGRYNRDSHFRAAADAALRAVRNPRCQPLKLPPEKYDQWKTIVIGFDPRDIL